MKTAFWLPCDCEFCEFDDQVERLLALNFLEPKVNGCIRESLYNIASVLSIELIDDRRTLGFVILSSG